jgi:hypothetical protein
MRKDDFIPAADTDLLALLERALRELGADLAAYGLTQEDAAELKEASDGFLADSSAAVAAATAAKAATARKNQSRKRAEAVLRRLSRQIKAGRGYTASVGVGLGIVAPKHSFDLATAKPQLTAIDRTGGAVQLTFVRYRTHGVNIYCKREGESDWVLVGRATISPFLDTRPLLQSGKAELRRYTAVYVYKDQEVGQFSDEVEIGCAP